MCVCVQAACNINRGGGDGDWRDHRTHLRALSILREYLEVHVVVLIMLSFCNLMQ